jgi:hypothetical protein
VLRPFGIVHMTWVLGLVWSGVQTNEESKIEPIFSGYPICCQKRRLLKQEFEAGPDKCVCVCLCLCACVSGVNGLENPSLL